MPKRLFNWQRADLASRPSEDWPGVDLRRPRLYARVYFATSHPIDTPWHWTLAEQAASISAGYEPAIESAIDAAEQGLDLPRDAVEEDGPANVGTARPARRDR
jgi:hypothetical protein